GQPGRQDADEARAAEGEVDRGPAAALLGALLGEYVRRLSDQRRGLQCAHPVLHQRPPPSGSAAVGRATRPGCVLEGYATTPGRARPRRRPSGAPPLRRFAVPPVAWDPAERRAAGKGGRDAADDPRRRRVPG